MRTGFSPDQRVDTPAPIDRGHDTVGAQRIKDFKHAFCSHFASSCGLTDGRQAAAGIEPTMGDPTRVTLTTPADRLDPRVRLPASRREVEMGPRQWQEPDRLCVAGSLRGT